MKHPLVFLKISIATLCLIFSCSRVVKKGKEIVHQTKEKVADKSDDVFPHFDAYTADTKYNKKRFKDFLKVELTPDIRNIYCFDDAIGIDADYQFSFNCNDSTAQRIIRKHNMTLDTETTDDALGLQTDFKWWDKKKIEKLPLYSWTDNEQYFQYFWYDKKEQKAYYFDFDM